MKFLKVCAVVLAISGVVHDSVYGMDGALERQGETRGGSEPVQVDSDIMGVVRASLIMEVQGAEALAANKVINLYTNGGDITQEDERTLKFNVKNVGSRYQISISGQDGLTNEDCNDCKWAVKASHGDSKIGVNIILYPAGGDEMSVDSLDPIEFQDNWTNGEWKVVVDPQQLTPDTVIDTYTGKMIVKIEATD